MSVDELRAQCVEARANALDSELIFMTKHGLAGALPGDLYRIWLKLEKDLFDKELEQGLLAKESKQ